MESLILLNLFNEIRKKTVLIRLSEQTGMRGETIRNYELLQALFGANLEIFLEQRLFCLLLLSVLQYQLSIHNYEL